MNDREFIELLNLYIDREISPEDALRLEAEVMTRPDRREVYTQYCKMQKACSLVSADFVNAPVEAQTASFWSFKPVALGLAAACALVVVGLQWKPAPAAPSRVASSDPVPPATAHVEAMQPVFQLRPAGQPTASFVTYSPNLQTAGLNWIGSVRLAPLAPVNPAAVTFAPKAELKAASLRDDPKDDNQSPEVAFRFQR
jgi:Putative zinc-finger